MNRIKSLLGKLRLQTSESWTKRKSMPIIALALDLIVFGVYHPVAKYCNALYGWQLMAASYSLGIILLVTGIPLLILGIKAARWEFKGDSWDTQNVYMLVKAYNERLEKLGLEHLKWSEKLSKGYIYKCAKQEKMFQRLEAEGKLEEVVALIKDEKSEIAQFIREMKGTNDESANNESFIDF